VVFTTLAGSADFEQVVAGPGGLLSNGSAAPGIIVDSTTISAEASENVRVKAAERDTALLAAPVSGNPKVVKAGRLTMVVSGPEAAYERSLPYLEILAGGGVTYVGEGDRARLVKVCHNLMLGIIAQTLAEILVLGEKGGVSRASMMEFLNNSVLGSTFTRYKTPAYVNLDFSPTFTPPLLLKDFDLGHDAARELGVPMPLAAAAQQVVQGLVGDGYTDVDFASLIALQAKLSGLELEPEGAPVSDGLERAA
jgi:3-hydroxyisobutyrate dehydrogenase